MKWSHGVNAIDRRCAMQMVQLVSSSSSPCLPTMCIRNLGRGEHACGAGKEIVAAVLVAVTTHNREMLREDPQTKPELLVEGVAATAIPGHIDCWLRLGFRVETLGRQELRTGGCHTQTMETLTREGAKDTDTCVIGHGLEQDPLSTTMLIGSWPASIDTAASADEQTGDVLPALAQGRGHKRNNNEEHTAPAPQKAKATPTAVPGANLSVCTGPNDVVIKA